MKSLNLFATLVATLITLSLAACGGASPTGPGLPQPTDAGTVVSPPPIPDAGTVASPDAGTSNIPDANVAPDAGPQPGVCDPFMWAQDKQGVCPDFLRPNQFRLSPVARPTGCVGQLVNMRMEGQLSETPPTNPLPENDVVIELRVDGLTLFFGDGQPATRCLWM